MQIFRQYTGEVIGTETAARPTCYGATGTYMCIEARREFFNQSIADFLHDDCGVDAAYEIRGGDTLKYLWINNVPFIFQFTSASTFYLLYSPYNSNANYLIMGNSSAESAYYVFESQASGNYNFGLSFVGTPDNFVFRIRPYNNSWYNSYYTCLTFIRGESLLTGKSVSMWSKGNAFYTSSSGTKSNGEGKPMFGVEINDDGTPDWENFAFKGSSSLFAVHYIPLLSSIASVYNTGPSKIPLVPVVIGPWKTKGLYLYPSTCPTVPSAVQINTEIQTEFETADGRRFINLVFPFNSASISYYANIGMIEVT